jgi:pilus assembly protein CpaC
MRRRGTLFLLLVGGALCSGAAWGQEATAPVASRPTTILTRPGTRTGALQPEVAPPPRTEPRAGPASVLDPFNPTRIRLPRMGIEGTKSHPCLPPITGPQPSEKDIEEFKQFIDGMVDPKSTIAVIVNRPRLMILKEPPVKTQIGVPETAQIELLGPREISILGMKPGTTVLNLWFTDPKDRTKEKILSYLIHVLPDPEAKTRLEQVYQALADEINDAFPDSYINLTLVGDKLVVSGQAKDIAEATQILRIVRAQAPPEETREIPLDSIQLYAGAEDLTDLRNFFLAGGTNVINLIRIPGEQQVMLRVTVAEVNRAAARSIGMNFAVTNDDGIQVFAQQTAAALLNNNLPITLDNGQTTIALNALRTLNYSRSLAEPVLTTMNGQTASFQAGGEFPVPVVTGFTAAGLQGVEFVPFGVLVNFTPYITDKDRIRLTIAADVSTRDLATGTQVNGSNVSGLTTRNFQTTVELREGQTLIVAGLLQNNLGGDAARVPFFGDLPIIGRLASLQRVTHAEQELVMLITPELVHPLEPDELLPLPGVDLIEPGDLEFYLLGRLESRRDYDYRSSVRTDIHKMLRYRHCEDIYIYGPKGHCLGPVVNGLDLNALKPAPTHRPETRVSK